MNQIKNHSAAAALLRFLTGSILDVFGVSQRTNLRRIEHDFKIRFDGTTPSVFLQPLAFKGFLFQKRTSTDGPTSCKHHQKSKKKPNKDPPSPHESPAPRTEAVASEVSWWVAWRMPWTTSRGDGEILEPPRVLPATWDQ